MISASGNARRVRGFWFEREIFESAAWRGLTATAMRVYGLFLLRRQFHKAGRKRFHFTNNGKLEFTYKEALHKHGIKEGAFREALDRLIEVGLLDVAETGAGMYKVKSLYALSDRWRAFGQPDFKQSARPKDIRHVGYQKWNVKKRSITDMVTIEGVGKTTRQGETAETGGASAVQAMPTRPEAQSDAPEAASEEQRGCKAGRVGEATRLSVGKTTLTSEAAREMDAAFERDRAARREKGQMLPLPEVAAHA